ncbi:hypothetical protein [Actinopolymorpha pittospori]|uniref:Uncharacterized protein n=1 Tax=Actinopolymorpha pittospori TaxID=648752 RepID=A0A927MU66_9ACTN|nr:hypothetical protein [Actinopolymorpha pittospori]MBE1606416.1 hypothetical protein [Actinopolymorpha pittospori]
MTATTIDHPTAVHATTVEGLHRAALLLREHGHEIPPQALYIVVTGYDRRVDVQVTKMAGAREQRWALVDRLAQICGNPTPEEHIFQGSLFYASDSRGWHIYTVDDIAEDGAA